MKRPPPPKLTPEQELFYDIVKSNNPFVKFSNLPVPPPTSLNEYASIKFRKFMSSPSKDTSFSSGLEYGLKLAETYYETKKSVDEYISGLLYQTKERFSNPERAKLSSLSYHRKNPISHHRKEICYPMSSPSLLSEKSASFRNSETPESTSNKSIHNRGKSCVPDLSIKQIRRKSVDFIRGILKKNSVKCGALGIRRKSVSWKLAELKKKSIEATKSKSKSFPCPNINTNCNEISPEKTCCCEEYSEGTKNSMRDYGERLVSKIVNHTKLRISSKNLVDQAFKKSKENLIRHFIEQDEDGFSSPSTQEPSPIGSDGDNEENEDCLEEEEEDMELFYKNFEGYNNI